MNIAKAIKDAREASGLTFKQLEDKTGRTKEYLQDIEEGNVPFDQMSKADIRELADAFGFPAEVFVILGLEDKDIKKGREGIADALLPPMRDLILSMIKDKDK